MKKQSAKAMTPAQRKMKKAKLQKLEKAAKALDRDAIKLQRAADRAEDRAHAAWGKFFELEIQLENAS